MSESTEVCPQCRKAEFESVDGGRYLRCVACRWLCRRTPDGEIVTAIPAATGFRPERGRHRKLLPVDESALDRLLREASR